uniref:DUF8040 domain-containing protein n=1 Tax=Cucumis melo TaxID=3656 RepID=A0A9I9E209_CUCME
MIHGSDLVCHQSTRMDQRCFAILCHLLRTIAGLMSMEVVDVEEMVAMYLACVTRKEISFTYLPVGKDQLWTHASSVMPF